jgi:VWFA-related protein
MRRVAIAGLILAACLAAQKKQKDAGEFHTPRLVRLNISAVDASRTRPGDLTAEDFQVFDNGKPQKIASFVKSDSRPRAEIKLAPHEFSNQTGAALPHATLILFDLLNDRLGSKGYAWTQIIQTLETLETNDYLYLYLLGSDGAFYPVHPLPDPDAAQTPDDGAWTRNIKAELDAAMSKATRLRPVDMTDPNLRVIQTYKSLEAISARLAAIPGRKNLVWITRGIPIELGPARTVDHQPIDYSMALRGLTLALERSNIAVYPVDIAPPGVDTTEDASTSGPGAATARAISPGEGVASADSLQQFADLTGGQAFLNNNVKDAIVQATGDARISYLLTYYPNPQAFDGKYHKIKLTCTRKGVKVHTKAGYYAYPEEPVTRTQQEATLDASIDSQFDASQIGLKAVLSPSKKFYNSVHIDLSISPATPVDADGGQFLITLADLHKDGKHGVSPTVSLDYKPGGPVPFAQERTVDGSVAAVRVIVMDAKSNAIGSLTIPITPSDLSPNAEVKK